MIQFLRVGPLELFTIVKNQIFKGGDLWESIIFEKNFRATN